MPSGRTAAAPPADPPADPRWAAQPAARALALPAECYVDPAFDALDRHAVLGAGWQLVGHGDALAGPGDHALADVAGVPLLLVRGDDGSLRALHNVCRHRGGPLAQCDGRGARALTCRYHGWTYALDGSLRGAPGMRAAAGFDPAGVRLPAARAAEWLGLVWAALDERAGPLAALVEGIAARAAACGVGAAGLAGWTAAARTHYDIACNWKVYVDNYLEGYHVARVHPRLAQVLDTAAYRTELAPAAVLQTSPLDPAASPYGAGAALYWWLWPNTMLNVLPGRVQTNRVLPTGAQTCRVIFETWLAPGTAAALATADAALADAVQAEDIAICAAVQRGLASGSYVPGRLNPAEEAGLWRFHELLRAAYRGAAPSVTTGG